jgi:hypothetical protein
MTATTDRPMLGQSCRAFPDVERAIAHNKRERVNKLSDLEINVGYTYSYQTKGPALCNLSARSRASES